MILTKMPIPKSQHHLKMKAMEITLLTMTGLLACLIVSQKEINVIVLTTLESCHLGTMKLKTICKQLRMPLVSDQKTPMIWWQRKKEKRAILVLPQSLLATTIGGHLLLTKTSTKCYELKACFEMSWLPSFCCELVLYHHSCTLCYYNFQLL